MRGRSTSGRAEPRSRPIRAAGRWLPWLPHNDGVSVSVRGMPWGVALFLLYAIAILGGVGLSLGFVVDQAENGPPVTPLGLVVMALLAYTIFTVTLVLQRKEAARALALGLASLAVPAIAMSLLWGLLIPAIFVAALAALLYRGLRSPAARAWLDQP